MRYYRDLVNAHAKLSVKLISSSAKRKFNIAKDSNIDSSLVTPEEAAYYNAFCYGAGSNEAFRYNFIKSEKLFLELIKVISKREDVKSNTELFYNWFLNKIQELK